MSHDYEHGRRDGLRLALAILAVEEAKWAALLGESRSGRTNAARDVRHKALRVPQKRVTLTPKDDEAMSAELAAGLEKVGVQAERSSQIRRLCQNA